MIKLIVAFDLHSGIGYKDTLPWHLPEDLARFKQLTSGEGKIVVMGSNTFRSIGKCLPNRANVILSRGDPKQFPSCALVTNSIEKVLKIASENDVWVIGGEDIYKQFLPFAHELYLTIVHTEVEVDRYLPDIDFASFRLIGVSDNSEIKKEKGLNCSFLTYRRIS